MIFPGRYIAALPPSKATGSTFVQAPVLKLSARAATGSSYDPVTITRPSGNTNICGYNGRLAAAAGIGTQMFVAGSKTSGIVALSFCPFIAPDVTMTRPFGSVVNVGYQRG